MRIFKGSSRSAPGGVVRYLLTDRFLLAWDADRIQTVQLHQVACELLLFFSPSLPSVRRRMIALRFRRACLLESCRRWLVPRFGEAVPLDRGSRTRNTARSDAVSCESLRWPFLASSRCREENKVARCDHDGEMRLVRCELARAQSRGRHFSKTDRPRRHSSNGWRSYTGEHDSRIETRSATGRTAVDYVRAFRELIVFRRGN